MANTIIGIFMGLYVALFFLIATTFKEKSDKIGMCFLGFCMLFYFLYYIIRYGK